MLVNSRSTHCFLDSAFTCGHSLPTTPTPPVELCLFDGTSNNIISEVVSLPVKFPSSECMTLDFYVTLLDSCCSLVLGVMVTGHKTSGESSDILQSVIIIQLTSRRILRD